MKPKKISIRPANNLEGEGLIVWIYHRKVQIQIHYVGFPSVDYCIDDAVKAWKFAMEQLRSI